MHNKSEDIGGFGSSPSDGGEPVFDALDCDGPLVVQALSSMLELIREQLGMDVFFISEFVQGRRVFRHVATAPARGIIHVGGSHAMEDSICQQVLDGRVPRLAHDLRVLRTRQLLPEVTKPIGTHISVPVVMPDGSIYGTLCGFAVERTVDLSERDVRRLEVAAQATARVLAQAAGHAAVG
ncbi:hypothetical protein H6CHR_05348 [Variovorax sp. PBL-H6]|uniref:GAF domain-containing protein n=1 Tax=Variovorax sp. PBL-H6 TaxID=434009 RepID=UPI00131886B5|nr:GAF domain-containing protein [Variovorax sp. PBL-H6]VTU38945.1 hypothetical protein H6CHR_05348 [Variovorax sp. PBL-H6]